MILEFSLIFNFLIVLYLLKNGISVFNVFNIQVLSCFRHLTHDQNHFNHESSTQSEHDRTEQLFEEDVNEEEDFEIPAFFKKTKILMRKLKINENSNIITGNFPFSSDAEEIIQFSTPNKGGVYVDLLLVEEDTLKHYLNLKGLKL